MSVERSMIKGMVLLVTIAVLGGVTELCASRVQHGSQEARDLFVEGAGLYADGDNIGAIMKLEECLMRYPRMGEARGILIIALGEEAIKLYRDGLWEEALPYLNKLLRILPDDDEIQMIYRKIKEKHAGAGDVDITNITGILRKEYRLDWMGYLGLGDDPARLDERLSYLEKMYAFYVGALVNADRITAEITRLLDERKRSVLTLRVKVRMKKALGLYRQSRFREAIDIWEQFPEKDYTVETEQYLIKAQVGLEGRMQALLTEAKLMQDSGLWKKALESWEEALRVDPRDISARAGIKGIHLGLSSLFNAGAEKAMKGDYQGALDEWQKIVAVYPEYRGIDRYLDLARTKMAVDKKATKSMLVASFIQEGDELQRQGKFLEAVKQWRKALKATPGDKKAAKRIRKLVSALYRRAEESRKQGNLRQATRILQFVSLIEPTRKKVKKKIARTVRKKKRADISLDLARAEGAFNAGKYLDALSMGRKVLKIDSKNKKAILIVKESALAQGIIYYRSEKLKEAIKQWDIVLRYAPGHQKAEKYKQRAKLKLGSIERLR